MKKINSISYAGRFFRILPLIALFMLPALPVFPCSSFFLKNGEQMVFGKNYDWHLEFGYLMINKRGVAKTAMQAGTTTDSPATWTSRYGSVTFNQYGREFPMGGVNEAGLAIEVMMLHETEYPMPDSRPVIKNLQWVQYQLDRFRTVEELLAGLSLVRIPPLETYGLHYFACDKTGQCASIEFLKGRTVIHTQETLPVPVLTNSTYRNSLSFFKQAGAHAAGDLQVGIGSLDRFARAAGLIQAFNPKKSGSLLDYASSILKSVAMGAYTKWSIIYDLRNERVYFKTLSKPELKFVDLRAIDFSCGTPVRALDLNLNAAGNVHTSFGNYTRPMNYELIKKALKQTNLHTNDSDELIRFRAAYPESTRCSN